MTKLLTAVLLIVSVAVIGFAQEPAAPKPGPEHKKIEAFAGKWNFSGKAESGPMGEGGPVTFTENCEMFQGGFALVCHAEGKNPMGSTKSMSIMSYDSEKKAYTYYAVESGWPPFQATGQSSDGKTWSWKTETKMGEKTMLTQVTVTLVSPTSQTFEMKMSTDGGKTWTPGMSGKSTKATS
jgi:hypothetical protein